MNVLTPTTTQTYLNGDANGNVLTSSASQYVTNTATLTGAQASQAVLLQLDTTGYQSISVQLTSIGTGVSNVGVRQSSDGSTWLSCPCSLTSNQATGWNSSITIGGTYACSTTARYIQLVLGTAQTAGATTVNYTLKTDAPLLSGVPVQLISGTVTVGGTYSAAYTGAPGVSTYSNTALSNTAVAVKTSNGNIYDWSFTNSNATFVYVQFFNLAVGSVTLGTTTPAFVIGVPPTQTATISLSTPKTFSTAISMACTTTAIGSTAPGTAIVSEVGYA